MQLQRPSAQQQHQKPAATQKQQFDQIRSCAQKLFAQHTRNQTTATAQAEEAAALEEKVKAVQACYAAAAKRKALCDALVDRTKAEAQRKHAAVASIAGLTEDMALVVRLLSKSQTTAEGINSKLGTAAQRFTAADSEFMRYVSSTSQRCQKSAAEYASATSDLNRKQSMAEELGAALRRHTSDESADHNGDAPPVDTVSMLAAISGWAGSDDALQAPFARVTSEQAAGRTLMDELAALGDTDSAASSAEVRAALQRALDYGGDLSFSNEAARELGRGLQDSLRCCDGEVAADASFDAEEATLVARLEALAKEAAAEAAAVDGLASEVDALQQPMDAAAVGTAAADEAIASMDRDLSAHQCAVAAAEAALAAETAACRDTMASAACFVEHAAAAAHASLVESHFHDAVEGVCRDLMNRTTQQAARLQAALTSLDTKDTAGEADRVAWSAYHTAITAHYESIAASDATDAEALMALGTASAPPAPHGDKAAWPTPQTAASVEKHHAATLKRLDKCAKGLLEKLAAATKQATRDANRCEGRLQNLEAESEDEEYALNKELASTGV